MTTSASTQQAAAEPIDRPTPTRSWIARVSRRDDPWFITARAARNRPLVQLLALAMIPNEESASYGVEKAERARAAWLDEHGDDDLDNEGMLELLTEVVRAAMTDVDTAPLTMGITAGFDSRPLLYVLRQLGYEPDLHTYGQPGNIDWDVVTWLGDRLGAPVTMIDTTSLTFSLETYEKLASKGNASQIGAGGHASRFMDTVHPVRVNVHGFLNDVLTGDNREKAAEATGDDRSAFIGRNNQFAFQQFMEPSLIDRLVPTAGIDESRELDVYRQYDLAYRQYSRIKPGWATDPRRLVYPFEDERWMGYWLSRPLEQRTGQNRWFRFIQSLDSPIFADLDGLEGEGKRLRINRKWRFYGHKGTPGIVDVSALGITPQHEPAFPFCTFALAHNNPSFRTVLDESLRRVRGRHIFRPSFLDTVERKFWDGDVSASKMINGIITTDIQSEVGRI